MKLKNVSVSVVDEGGGKLKVWNASFTINGSLPTKNGYVDNDARRKKEKEIARLLESLDFPEE